MPTITIPDNFAPTIPERGTRAFVEYAADVMLYDGPIACRLRYCNDTWTVMTSPNWDWCGNDYAKLPKPKPKVRRWYTWDEFVATFLSAGRILVREGERGHYYVADAWGCSNGFYLVTTDPDVTERNFRDFQYSTDHGKTWQEFGVEE
jgi:hypothetical protein